MNSEISYEFDFSPPRKEGTPQTSRALEKKRGKQRVWRLPIFKWEGDFFTATVTLNGECPEISFRKWRSRKSITMPLADCYAGAVFNQMSLRL